MEFFTYIVIEIVAAIGNGWRPIQGPKSTSTVEVALNTPEAVLARLCDGDSHWGHYGFHSGQGVRVKAYVFPGLSHEVDLFWCRLDEAVLTADFEI
jgi:hypothetical protein